MYLVGLIEEQAEVGEDDPEFLPAGAALELTQQVTTEQVLSTRHKPMAFHSTQHKDDICTGLMISQLTL